MKKIIILLVSLLIILACTSCSNKEQINNEFFNDNDVNQKDITQTTNEKETDETDHPGVPTMLTFSSYNELNEFIHASNGEKKQFAEFADRNLKDNVISFEAAKDIASNVSIVSIPNVKDGVVITDFGGTYYVERNELSIIFKINDVRYRFVYSYEAKELHEYKGTPIIQKLQLGNMEIDMYEGDECFVGSTMIEGVVVRVIIYTDNVEKVTFNDFDLTSISKIAATK